LAIDNKKVEAEKVKQDKIKAEQLAQKVKNDVKEKAAHDAILDANFRLKTT
jgi:hypothetical protein